MKSLSSGGATRRTACGSTTWRIACPSVSPTASARGALARVHRLDPGAVDLGHVGRVGERERDPAEHDRVGRQPVEHQRRDAEADQVDDEDRRHAAQHVDEDGRPAAAAGTARACARSAPARPPGRAISTTISTITNSFTSSQNPRSTSGNESELRPVEERLADGRPALARDDRASSPPSTTTVEIAEISGRRARARGAGRLAGEPALAGARDGGRALLQLGRAAPRRPSTCR